MSQTIIDVFKESVDKYGKRDALAFLSDKKYKTITYQALDNYRLQIAKWWQDLGLKQGEKLAVMLPNSPEWVIADLAAASLGLTLVPVHSTFNGGYLANLVNHAQADYLLIDQINFAKHKDTVKNLSFKKIFLVGKHDNPLLLAWPNLDPNLVVSIKQSNIKPDDLHIIIYTSGTTGDPKGVMLSHKNIVVDALSAIRRVPINHQDRFFSFLPLSHAFERMAGYYCPMFVGASIYFAQSPKTMVADIKLAKPTVLPSVPRIFEKIYDKIYDKIRNSGQMRKQLFYQAIDLARARRHGRLPWSQLIKYKILNILVLKKLRQIFGGSLRLAISGGSSLNPMIGKFFENLGIKNIEGYGLTETSPIVAINKLDFYKYGTVGPAIDCNRIRIAEDKEILIKGDNLMLGYYNNPEATADVMVDDGWFKTGDLGFIDNDGFLTIIGRAKDMIVLSTGKKVFPEPIENVLNANKYISQSMVYGSKNKHISALIVPDKAELAKWCEKSGLQFAWPEILEKTELKEFYQQQITKALEHLANIEQINHFKLLNEEFSQENGMLTLTLKLRRQQILRNYIVY